MRSPSFLIVLAVSTVLGIAAGLAVHHMLYGRYESNFGPYTFEGEVTAANLASVVNLEESEDHARLTVIDGTTFDFGSMSLGESGEHFFVVRNDGKADLTLEIGGSTCKCTLGDLDLDRLPPGETTEVRLSWTVKTNEDRFAQEAQLWTNDPTNGIVPLKIVGRVLREYELEPRTLTFGSVTPSQKIDVETQLYNYSENTIKVTSSKITDPRIDELATIEVTPIEKQDFDSKHKSASQGFRVAVHIEPGIAQGNVSQNVLLGFQRFDADGKVIETSESANIGAEHSQVENQISMYIPLQGGVVGTIRMVTNSRLRAKTGGGYLYMLDRIPSDEVTKGTALMLLKGEDRDDVKISIDSVYPEGIVTAKLGEVKEQKTMSLVPIEFEIDPKGESLDYQGLAGDDKSYGRIMLSTDKDTKASMALYLKFVTEDQ